ncbi:MAG: hypothetical protein V1674_06500 [Candidatus Omnitrophota bacterium]
MFRIFFHRWFMYRLILKSILASALVLCVVSFSFAEPADTKTKINGLF